MRGLHRIIRRVFGGGLHRSIPKATGKWRRLLRNLSANASMCESDSASTGSIFPRPDVDRRGRCGSGEKTVFLSWSSLTLLVILIGGVALRAWLVYTSQGINSDAYRYALTARQMAEHGLIAGMKGDFLWPFYPLNRNLVTYPFLGSLILPFTGDAVLSLRLVSAGAGVGLIVLIYLITQKLFQRKGLSLLSAGLMAFHSELARASAAVYREVLMGFMLAGALYLFLRALDDRRWSYAWAAGAGIVVFLCSLTRPEGFLALGALGASGLVLCWGKEWQRWLQVSAVMVIAFTVLQVPYMMWMKETSGRWLFNQWQIMHEADTRECIQEEFRPGGGGEGGPAE